jgi:hypothetical protein
MNLAELILYGALFLFVGFVLYRMVRPGMWQKAFFAVFVMTAIYLLVR